jgi:hypothetical protein
MTMTAQPEAKTAVSEALHAEEVAHSSLGASSAKRWMNCTASPQLTAKLPEEERRGAGYAADEGTAAHEVAARCLKEDKEPWEFIGTEIIVGSRSFTVDDEMADAVAHHVSFVYDLCSRYAEHDAMLSVEVGLYSDLHSKAFGTSDVVLEVPGLGLLIIVDYKHGIGVTAEPHDEQTNYYGYLAVERSDHTFEQVQLYIVQPRHPHPKGVIRRYDTTPEELTDWFLFEVIPAMEETESPHAKLKVGDWCRFCPAQAHCPAIRQAEQDLDPDLEPVYLTDEQLGDILQRAPTIKKYIENLEKEAFERAKKGSTIPGQKIVRKQSSRIWKTGAEEALQKTFGDEAYEPRKMKGPAAVEKLKGGSSIVTKYAYKPDAGLTLAPVSDKRAEAKITPEDFFGEVPPEQ